MFFFQNIQPSRRPGHWYSKHVGAIGGVLGWIVRCERWLMIHV